MYTECVYLSIWDNKDQFLACTTDLRAKEGLEQQRNMPMGCPESLGFGGVGRIVGCMWRMKEKGCHIGVDDAWRSANRMVVRTRLRMPKHQGYDEQDAY